MGSRPPWCCTNSDQDKVYYPSLMHRGVAFNNRLGWIRYSPAGFGKDASGYLMTKPTWIISRCGNRHCYSIQSPCQPTDRRISFGEEGITDVFLTTGKTSSTR